MKEFNNKKVVKTTKGHAFLGIDFENPKTLILSSIVKKHNIWGLLESNIGRLTCKDLESNC